MFLYERKVNNHERKHQKKQIEELRSIVTSLYRSAGQLDQSLQVIENTLPVNGEDSEYFKMLVAHESRHRKDCKRVIFGDLEKREDTAWTNLLESLKEEA